MEITHIFRKEFDSSDLTLTSVETILIDIVHLRRHTYDRQIVWFAKRVALWNDNALPRSE